MDDDLTDDEDDQQPRRTNGGLDGRDAARSNDPYGDLDGAFGGRGGYAADTPAPRRAGGREEDLLF
jgi:hypothetical protein